MIDIKGLFNYKRYADFGIQVIDINAYHAIYSDNKAVNYICDIQQTMLDRMIYEIKYFELERILR